MFEKRRTVKTLRKLARDRAKALRVRVPGNFRMVFGKAWLWFLWVAFSAGVAVIMIVPPGFAPAGVVGLILLLLFWNRVFLDAGRPAAFLSLYPASAERIWEARFGIFKWSSLWSLIAALAIVCLCAARHIVSVPEACASAPAALAYAACMMSLPLALLLAFPSFNPGRLISLLIFPAVIFMFSAKELPAAVTARIGSYLGATAWFSPLGWLCHFMKASMGPVQRLIFGTGALLAGAAPIRSLADAVKRKLVRREVEVDERDARISIVEDEWDKKEEEGLMTMRGASQGAEKPVGAARALLEGRDWGTFAGPRTPGDRLFWRTLGSRQKMVARLMWPYGFSSAGKLNKLALRFGAICLAFAAISKFLGMVSGAWSGIAFGIMALLMFVPLLPGYAFVLQSLYLNGRQTARHYFFPVSIPEICNLLHRYQTIRVAMSCWAGILYGTLAWAIMGLPILAGAVNGFLLVLVVYGFHPIVLMAKLSGTTRCAGRPLASIPCALFLIIYGFFALVCLILGIVFVVVSAQDEAKFHAWQAIALEAGVAVGIRFAGWAMLRLYLVFIQRSWVDVVTRMPQRPARAGR